MAEMRPLFELDHGASKEWTERDLRFAVAITSVAVLLAGIVALLVEL